MPRGMIVYTGFFVIKKQKGKRKEAK